jgi:two-component system, NtrC family, response regulator HydG
VTAGSAPIPSPPSGERFTDRERPLLRQSEIAEPRLAVLVVDDELALCEVLSLRIAGWGHDVRIAMDASDAEREIELTRPDLVLCDLVLPGASGMDLLKRIKARDERLPIVMMTAHSNVDGAVEAMKSGAADFLTKPLDYGALYSLLEVNAIELRRRRESRSLVARLDNHAASGVGLIGRSRAVRALRRTITSLASSDASAILTGESGTGKEVTARAIHAASARRDKPFVAINAAAIPDGLVESEIFGHEQGAFTGAIRSRPGVFELANGGTLFLDEIAEMPIALQPKLLRVLDDGRARRLGGSRDMHFDVRVLAATNRNPARAIRDGRLREDLYYRLNVFELRLPPLRDRSDDVPLLAQYFVRELGQKHGLEVEGLSDSAHRLLEAHAWPGNVRELRNVIERATILARTGWIEPRQTLDRVGYNKAEAARQLGLDVKTIRNKLRAYGDGA